MNYLEELEDVLEDLDQYKIVSMGKTTRLQFIDMTQATLFDVYWQLKYHETT